MRILCKLGLHRWRRDVFVQYNTDLVPGIVAGGHCKGKECLACGKTVPSQKSIKAIEERRVAMFEKQEAAERIRRISELEAVIEEIRKLDRHLPEDEQDTIGAPNALHPVAINPDKK
jgi:hypothetical protein